MNERWVCKRCFADNDDTSSTCHRCGLIRGAEATGEDQASWAASAAGQPGAPAGDSRPAWQRLLRFWWVPALAVALVVGYLTTARRGDSGELASAGRVTVDELRVGDCFNSGDELEISEVDGVPCTEPHEDQVFHLADYQAATYPADEEAWGAAFLSVCAGPFASFVGEPYDTSELFAYPITPTEESWSDGDRGVICVVYDDDNPELTTSLEGANR